ncbi:MAG: SH3 domain-containing protein [Pseudomonadota bacterium]
MRFSFIKKLLLLTALSVITGNSTHANSLRLEVIDPYLELHTGPGRGYPIFYVIEEGESIEVITRRPDWYEVKTRNGKIGWVTAKQISRTLEPTGEPVDIPTVSYGDFLQNSWRVGFSSGQFFSEELEDANTATFLVGYRVIDWFSADLEVAKFYGDDIRGDYYTASFQFEPFSQWRVSPVIHIGGGVLGLSTQPELAPVDFDNSNFYSYGLGANFYLGRNFVINAGYRGYTVLTDEDDVGIEKWNIGFNAYF